jgi:hypothetical protein
LHRRDRLEHVRRSGTHIQAPLERRLRRLRVEGRAVVESELLAQTLTQGMVTLGVASVAVVGGRTLAITLLTVLIGQFAPSARATALAIQAFMLDVGASGGAWLSVRRSWRSCAV